MSDEIEGQLEGGSESVESQVEGASNVATQETGQQAAPSQPSSPWEAFKSLPDFQGAEDTAIVQRLYQSYEREKQTAKALQQYQQLLPYTKEYLTYRPEFQKWRDAMSRQGQQPQQAPQRPQQPQQAQAPEEHRWWNPPEVRESYKRYLVRDESGREVIDPEAPLDAKHALYEYQKYKADFASKFLSDPQQTLGPMVEKVAQEKAQQIVQAQLQSYQETQYVSSLEEQNKDWLYEKDGQTPTQEGLAVNKYIDMAARMGIQSIDDRWEFATSMLERDLHQQIREHEQQNQQRQAFQQAIPQPVAQPAPAAPMENPQETGAQNQAERDIQFLRREATRNPSRTATPPDPRIPVAPKTFEDRLRAIAAKSGLM
jgi:hypothetical protein